MCVFAPELPAHRSSPLWICTRTWICTPVVGASLKSSMDLMQDEAIVDVLIEP